MCGRFALHANPEVVALQFGLAAEPTVEARYNIAPSLNVLIVRQDVSGRRLSDYYYRWGLIPGWAKDPAIGNKCANARGETVAEKPAFRTAFRHWRCLVPASGFYEWKTEGGRKQPYYIRPRRSEDLFGLAGITELWTGPKGAVRSVCLITTVPNELMKPLHDRMPVIVPPERVRVARSEQQGPRDAKGLHRPVRRGAHDRIPGEQGGQQMLGTRVRRWSRRWKA